ncbi:MAG TPA: hypothetical protein VL769_11485 [Acidimicrobiia bacterium]|nr:hypothetical protein [Acidimicrobiia bacterium]
MDDLSGDASVLVSAIEARHPNPFRNVSRDVLLREAARVDSLSSNNRSALTVELMRTIALLGPRNGHTAIHPLDNHPMPRHAYPLALHEFDDGVFVIAAENCDLVGAELVAVDGVAITDVLRAVTPLIAHDNEWTIRARRPAFVVNASVLRGLGLVDDDNTATFRLRRPSTSTVDVELDAVSAGSYWDGLAGSDWSPAFGVSYLRRGNEWHWAEPTADGRVVHVGYNVTLGDVSEFARDVDALAASARARLVVLDLRLNGGGDNRTYEPLLTSMQRLGDTTRLAVLTSRMTFSAAMQLVVELEQKTAATFVGEPTGGSPNQYGDAIVVELPNAGLNAHVATIAWQTAGASDDRLTREPDIPVVDQSKAYFADEDPVLNTAVGALA